MTGGKTYVSEKLYVAVTETEIFFIKAHRFPYISH